jgi:hypothetical protein
MISQMEDMSPSHRQGGILPSSGEALHAAFFELRDGGKCIRERMRKQCLNSVMRKCHCFNGAVEGPESIYQMYLGSSLSFSQLIASITIEDDEEV